jgi:chemotaxis protein methyltransferase CheR
MSLSPLDFHYIADLVRDESAIVLESGKEYLVESRLIPLTREEGIEGIAGLVKKLKEPGALVLKNKVVEALTTNETSFYRDLRPFDMLREMILPELIEKRASTRTIRLWSAAASTGQEIYSIAMLIKEHFPELLSWKIELLATDLSKDVLQKAESGVYSQVEVNRGLPVTLLIKYFEKNGSEWAIKDDLRKMVSFSELNLIRPWRNISNVDIVFMRNVLIYFDVEVKRTILGNVRKAMKPDGYLFLGAAETTLNLDENFTRKAFERTGCYVLGEK